MLPWALSGLLFVGVDSESDYAKHIFTRHSHLLLRSPAVNMATLDRNKKCFRNANSEDIVELFNRAFIDSECTRLEGGHREPLYRPKSSAMSHHCIYFREDYVASALHEVAHWCIAGRQRRGLVDYGYWYEPEGRSIEQQREFERVEIKPQALEWLFSNACDHSFYFSSDSFMAPCNSDYFPNAVLAQVRRWCAGEALPERGLFFLEILIARYKLPDVFNINRYYIK